MRRQQHHQQKLAFLTITSLAEKQKGGDVEASTRKRKQTPGKPCESIINLADQIPQDV